jgi:hypothetical protein
VGAVALHLFPQTQQEEMVDQGAAVVRMPDRLDLLAEPQLHLQRKAIMVVLVFLMRLIMAGAEAVVQKILLL